MPRRVTSKSECNGAMDKTSNDGADLMTGISSSREKVNGYDQKKVNNTKEKHLKHLEHDNHKKQTFFFKDDIIGQRYWEATKSPALNQAPRTKIIWKRTQKVIELPILGHFRTYEKRVERSRPNPWRRHGALVKIYEIGGWITKVEKQQISRRERKYFYVKPGSKPCNPPLRPPISIRDSKFLPPSSVTIKAAKNRSIEELAFIAAVHIQEAIQHSISIFLASYQNGSGKNDKNDECHTTGRIISAGKSATAQCLSNRSVLSLDDKNSLFDQKLR